MTIQQIETEAVALARKGGITKEQAFTQLLEANPEAYAAYRVAHNAAPMVERLRAAGLIR